MNIRAIRESLAAYGLQAEVVSNETGEAVIVTDETNLQNVLVIDSECVLVRGFEIDKDGFIVSEIVKAVRKFL